MRQSEVKKMTDAHRKRYFLSAMSERESVGEVRSNSCENHDYSTPVNVSNIQRKREFYSNRAMRVVKSYN